MTYKTYERYYQLSDIIRMISKHPHGLLWRLSKEDLDNLPYGEADKLAKTEFYLLFISLEDLQDNYSLSFVKHCKKNVPSTRLDQKVYFLRSKVKERFKYWNE